MTILILLLLLSVAGVMAAFVLPGWSDLILLAGPSAIACLLLLGMVLWRQIRGGADTDGTQDWIVVDGSNVMYWKTDQPDIAPVREVVRHLSSLGFTTGVMFDANAGYLVSGQYRHDGHFGNLLELPKDRVMVVPKGTIADTYILTAARDLGARIVTNDRFRDWAGDHPEVREPGHLIRGGYRSGRLWLELEVEGSEEKATP